MHGNVLLSDRRVNVQHLKVLVMTGDRHLQGVDIGARFFAIESLTYYTVGRAGWQPDDGRGGV